jgi:hypothetical protein
MIRFVGSITLIVVAFASLSPGRKEETLKELIARADAASPDHKPDLYMEVADRQMKTAGDALKGGRTQEFRTSLDGVVQFCDKARDAALRSNKHIKNVEIKIRRLSTHLRDVKLDADVDDQPTVEAAIDKLESFRTELLKKMFGGKSND